MARLGLKGLRRLERLLCPCLPVLCHLFLTVHCSESSIHVLPGFPLGFLSFKFPSNSSKAFEPLEPLKTCQNICQEQSLSKDKKMRTATLTEMILKFQTWEASFFKAQNSSEPEHLRCTPAKLSQIWHSTSQNYQTHSTHTLTHYYTTWCTLNAFYLPAAR